MIFRAGKTSPQPGPRAQKVNPSAKGEGYSYQVDKFWLVSKVLEDGNIEVRTRRGKKHLLSPNDPRLRKPKFWERWLAKDRFLEIEKTVELENQAESAKVGNPEG